MEIDLKRPSFQFYPADWLRDTALRSCSTGARGLWIDMICFMHEGNPYGYLKVGDKVILPSNLARMCGLSINEVEGWLEELKESGVYDIDEEGTIFCRRMIRDENLRMMRAAGGILGGNPALKVNLSDNHRVNLKVQNEVKQKSTPSSSSSSSSSKKNTATIVATPEGVSDLVWQDFVKHRKAKKAQITDRVIEDIAIQAKLAGWTLDAALKETIVRNWQSFKAAWVEQKPRFPDVSKSIVPSRIDIDPALVKARQDALNASPPSLEVLAKLAALRNKSLN